jgi:hypothetical protein
MAAAAAPCPAPPRHRRDHPQRVLQARFDRLGLTGEGAWPPGGHRFPGENADALDGLVSEADQIPCLNSVMVPLPFTLQ